MLAERRIANRVTTCARCQRTFDGTSWTDLLLLERAHREQLRHLLVEWPWRLDAHLEVRACRCGEPVARLITGGPR